MFSGVSVAGAAHLCVMRKNSKLASGACPSCRRRFTSAQLPPHWGFIRTELECPFCRAQLVIDRRSRRRARFLPALLVAAVILGFTYWTGRPTEKGLVLLVLCFVFGYTVYVATNIQWEVKTKQRSRDA